MSKARGTVVFTLIVVALFLLRVLLGFASAPAAVAPVLDIIVTILFVATPIIAVFFAARDQWDAKTGGIYVAIGAVFHVLGAFLIVRQVPPVGIAIVLVQSFIQAGIAFWTLGLGALVAVLIRDKNLILPVAIVLAGLDMFLVFNPDAPTAKIVRQNPALFQSMAYSVPALKVSNTEASRTARVVPKAFVGPADLLFISTFVLLLTKFKMRVQETVRWLVPVMILYLVIVMLPVGMGMLPALVPIGATVLIVNRKEFQMSTEEKAMTWGSVVLAALLAGVGLFRHFTAQPAALPAGPGMTVDGRDSPGSGSTPPPEALGQPRS